MPPLAAPRRSRALAPVVVAALATLVLAVLLAQGASPGADVVVWAPEARGGLQVGDWPIAVVALLGTAACAAGLVRSRPAGSTALVLAALVLTVLAATLLKGDGPDSGRTLVAFGAGMGLNVGDLPVLATWLLGVTATALAGRLRPARSGDPVARPHET